MTINYFSKSIFRVPVFSFEYITNILKLKDDSWIGIVRQNDAFMHGLLIASYEFHNEFVNYEKITDEFKKEKIKQTVLKYVIRSATRCIPFGVFSGLGTIENSKNNAIQDNITAIFSNQNTKFDATFLSNLILELKNEKIIIENLIYYPNSSIYRISNKCRYFETQKNAEDTSGTINFEFSEVKNNYYLDKILNYAVNGCSYEGLVLELVDEDITFLEAKDFIDSLIDNNLLCSELELSTLNETTQSNEENLSSVLKRIYEKTKDKKVLWFLNVLLSNIETFKKMNHMQINDSYETLNNQTNHLRSTFEFPLTQGIINKEIYFETENVLGAKTLRSVINAAKIYHNLLYNNKITAKQRIDYFKEEFQKRYEREFVPLVIVLDIETGIGYDSSFRSAGIDDSAFIKNFPQTNEIKTDDIAWSIFDSFIIKKISNAVINNLQDIELSEEELNKFQETNSNDIKNRNSSIRFSLYENDTKQNVYFQYLAYSSLNSTLGRFWSGNKKIQELSSEINSFEKEQGVVYAEIDHIPNTSMVNFLNRNLIDEFKIVYLGGNDNSNKKIRIEDLYVSVVDNEVVLYSKKLKKKIIPKFSNAFNQDYPASLPLFKFLLDLNLQYKEREVGYFPIKKYHNFFRSIPRITYKNIIFSRQSWLVTYKDFFSTIEKDINEAEIHFSENKKKQNLPQYFVILEEDTELMIDSENKETIRIFLKELKKKSNLHIQEFLLATHKSIIKNENNENLNNEFFLPINIDVRNSGKILNSITLNSNKIKRTFLPGEEWIYFKVYLGSKTATEFLIDSYKLLKGLLKNTTIDKFFFLKFNDPNNHLRIRIQLNSVESYDHVTSLIKNLVVKYQKQALIYDLQIATYKREIERYGLDNIETTEAIFFIDSKITIEILKHTKLNKDENSNWLFSLLVIDIYFKAFELDLIQSINLVNEIIYSLGVELNTNSSTTKFINLNYQKNKGIIKEYLTDENLRNWIHFKDFSNSLTKKVSELKSQNGNNRESYIPHFVHIHVTRMFGAGNNKKYEYNLYNFYIKYLKEKYHTSNVK